MKKRIENAFDDKVKELGQTFLNFPWERESAYANWIAQTYYFVRHTTVLVSLSAARFGAQNRDHHYRMLAHLADERGHDLMALEDLQNLGWRLEQIPEFSETRLFYQNQYYMINFEDPFSHLGYSLCLEGLAALYAPEVFKRVSKTYGKGACEFLRVHATVDQDHYADGAKELAHLTDTQAEAALRNLEQSAILYSMILERAAKAPEVLKAKKSA